LTEFGEVKSGEAACFSDRWIAVFGTQEFGGQKKVVKMTA
jgi:hypothetical protein